MVFKRILANMVDMILFFAILVGAYLHINPFFIELTGGYTYAAIITTVLVIAAVSVIQYQFMRVDQTVGKAFFGLKIISSNDEMPLTPSIIFQREIFAKVATGYLLCLPSLLGKTGGHEVVTNTKVVSK